MWSILQSGPWLQRRRHKHPQFSEFETLRQLHSPHLICSHHSQPGIGVSAVGLFDMLNLIVPSVLPSAQWLLRCKHKRHRFSQFETLQRVYFPLVMYSHHRRLDIRDPILGLLDARKLLVLSILRSDQRLQCCKHNIPNFWNVWPCDSQIHHIWYAPTTLSQTLQRP